MNKTTLPPLLEFAKAVAELSIIPPYMTEQARQLITLQDMASVAIEADQQSRDREDTLIETILEACTEWSQYVEVDTAPRTLREHIQLVIDHVRRVEGVEHD